MAAPIQTAWAVFGYDQHIESGSEVSSSRSPGAEVDLIAVALRAATVCVCPQSIWLPLKAYWKIGLVWSKLTVMQLGWQERKCCRSGRRRRRDLDVCRCGQGRFDQSPQLCLHNVFPPHFFLCEMSCASGGFCFFPYAIRVEWTCLTKHKAPIKYYYSISKTSRSLCLKWWCEYDYLRLFTDAEQFLLGSLFLFLSFLQITLNHCSGKKKIIMHRQHEWHNETETLNLHPLVIRQLTWSKWVKQRLNWAHRRPTDWSMKTQQCVCQREKRTGARELKWLHLCAETKWSRCSGRWNAIVLLSCTWLLLMICKTLFCCLMSPSFICSIFKF